jgi:NADPH-dependent 2,4-dienoyl-CoA reductase/sulfur reductase-like enzyme
MTDYRFVILGGGMVAGYAAKELVEQGLKRGELGIVSSDTALPYERPPLSKGFLAGKEDEASTLINDAGFYQSHGIDVHLGIEIDRLDPTTKRLHARTGEEFSYEKLLAATGARVRTLRLPGADLDDLFYLRSLDDSKRIRAAAAQAEQAAVVGAGFIGMEVASVLAEKGVKTTMLFPEERVWQRFFTPEMSAFFERYYEGHGVSLLRGQSLKAFEGDGKLSAVVVESGQRLPVQMAVAGIGVAPATELFQSAGVAVENGVVTNEYLETSVHDIYAAGDVASYWDVLYKKRRRVEHWDNAVEQGKHAARLLAGQRAPFVHVPYFFSDVFDLSYEFWGDVDGSDQVIYRGDVSRGAFSVWWLRDERTIAAFVMNRPDEERELAPQLIAEQQPLPKALLAEAHTGRS